MAGLELRLTSPAAAVLELRLGEELTNATSVLSPMRTSNDYAMTWTAPAGESSFEQHEYMLFRYPGQNKFVLKTFSRLDFSRENGVPFKVTFLLSYVFLKFGIF